MSGVLNISVTPKRMLTKTEAAHYCARPAKRFEAECGVSPVEFANGDLRWDMHDLNGWIESLKSEGDNGTSAILARLT